MKRIDTDLINLTKLQFKHSLMNNPITVLFNNFIDSTFVWLVFKRVNMKGGNHVTTTN